MRSPVTLSRRKSPLALQIIKPHCRNSPRNHQQKLKGESKYLINRLKMLRSEMEEISEEQKEIKEGQRQVREKFEAVEMECDQLRKETNLIMQQSLNTQIRLAFMFQILKARQNQEFDKAAMLTVALRELIARENQKK
ncbi:uncharacterized protein LOC111287969 [Durio zibethinus]|uniref:Uncharacterized protein LOC111287969 n=1 Tax=Durio zibethinus TaxID=66656 RepID=A0A6P5Y1S4_DURZI|nr:uncharacterized protein LOC111287969 [Durio zibethinus]